MFYGLLCTDPLVAVVDDKQADEVHRQVGGLRKHVRVADGGAVRESYLAVIRKARYARPNLFKDLNKGISKTKKGQKFG